LKATVKKMKNIAKNANRPIDERKIAAFRPRFLRVITKMPDTDKSAIKAKSAEKGI
jgi:hypothetical protein